MRAATFAFATTIALALAAMPASHDSAIAREASQPATLTIAFEVAPSEGRVMIGLYDEAGWDGGEPVRGGAIDIASGETSVTFEGLPAGRYGVKAFHDLNGNGDLDTNPFGMPTEPFAFSNNAVGQMGPASWSQASFDAPAGKSTHTIALD